MADHKRGATVLLALGFGLLGGLLATPLGELLAPTSPGPGATPAPSTPDSSVESAGAEEGAGLLPTSPEALAALRRDVDALAGRLTAVETALRGLESILSARGGPASMLMKNARSSASATDSSGSATPSLSVVIPKLSPGCAAMLRPSSAAIASRTNSATLGTSAFHPRRPMRPSASTRGAQRAP